MLPYYGIPDFMIENFTIENWYIDNFKYIGGILRRITYINACVVKAVTGNNIFYMTYLLDHWRLWSSFSAD